MTDYYSILTPDETPPSLVLHDSRQERRDATADEDDCGNVIYADDLEALRAVLRHTTNRKVAQLIRDELARVGRAFF